MVTLDDLRGLWRRSLIVLPDGRRDTTSFVAWLQGVTRFADLRQPEARPDFSTAADLHALTAEQVSWLATQQGFAGVLSQDGDMFTWSRLIDYQPPTPLPDVGRLWFEPTADGPRHLVERGRDIDYVEHWNDAPGDTAPCWSATLRHQDSPRSGLVLRVGRRFMLARSRAVTLPASPSLAECVAGAGSLAAAREMVDCEVSLGRVEAGAWTIERSTLPFREGRALAIEPHADILRLDRTEWRLDALEGDPVA